MLAPWKKSYDQTIQHIKKQRHYFANKGPSGQSCGLSSGHVWIENWTIKKAASKNWCFWTVVLEKTLESTLDCREIQPVNPKGTQSWIFTGRVDAEAEAPILFGHLMWRTGSLEKTLMRTWVWASSWTWWWTAKPGMLQSMGLQRFGHDWATELNWTEAERD